LKTKLHYFTLVVDQKAAPIPHSAMIVEEIRIVTSMAVAFLSKEIFAAIGPMTHNVKTEKDPRIAIIEPNSGTSIDTVTARKRKLIRSQATNTRLSV
jgi:hypothetical protein